MPLDYNPCACVREQVGTSGQERGNSENWASNQAVAFAHVEFPAILADGGDDRLVLNAKGVNKYHCRPEVSSSARGRERGWGGLREHSTARVTEYERVSRAPFQSTDASAHKLLRFIACAFAFASCISYGALRPRHAMCGPESHPHSHGINTMCTTRCLRSQSKSRCSVAVARATFPQSARSVLPKQPSGPCRTRT
jgi:hypothetical protein